MSGRRGGGSVGGGGVRMDVNEELKFLGEFKKKNWGGSGGLGRGAGCRVRGGGAGLGGQGGCE